MIFWRFTLRKNNLGIVISVWDIDRARFFNNLICNSLTIWRILKIFTLPRVDWLIRIVLLQTIILFASLCPIKSKLIFIFHRSIYKYQCFLFFLIINKFFVSIHELNIFFIHIFIFSFLIQLYILIVFISILINILYLTLYGLLVLLVQVNRAQSIWI